MPTGLQVNKGFAQMGNINIQAVKPQSENNNFGTLNVSNAAVVAANQVVSTQAGNISQNSTLGVVPNVNEFQNLLVTVPLIQFQPIQNAVFNVNTLAIAPFINSLFQPGRLKGISSQRPEVLSLADFGPIYEKRSGTDLSDVGDFVNTSIAARKLRFDHIEALMQSIQEVEDANKILNEIAGDYADQVLEAKNTVAFMTKIAKLLKEVRKSFDIRNSENLKNMKFAKEVAPSLSYKELMVEQYGFSESGFANFSNTKILGQFFNDIRNTFRQYSPTLFGTNDPPPPSGLNVEAGFVQNQPTINGTLFNMNSSLGEAAQQSVERNADKDFGNYNAVDADITDGQFNFQVRLFRNAGFSLLGTPFNQFLDILPGNSEDRTTLLLMTLSKELRISSGLGQTRVRNLLFERFGGNDVSDPFDFIVGDPGDTIAEPVVGGNSLCSLLRYTNDDGEVVLPFESAYVRGEDGRVYVPGTKELVDSILQSEKPYDISKLRSYRRRLSNVSSDAISLIRKLLDVGKNRPRIKPIDLFNEIGQDYVETVDLLVGDLPSEPTTFPGTWGEAALIKLAFSNREVKQLLFQYVLTVGMLGKPSEGEFGSNSVEPFFKEMTNEITTWGELPVIAGDKNLSSDTTQSLINVLDSFGIENSLNPDFSTPETDILGNNSTTKTTSGFVTLAFIAQRLLNIAKQVGSPGNLEGERRGGVINSVLLGNLISTKKLIILNRITDFIATIARRSNDFIEDGRTRFNKLNTTTLAAFAFEAYLSFLEPLMSAISAPNTNEVTTEVAFNIEELRESQRLVVLLLGNYASISAILTGATPREKLTLFASLRAQALSTPAGNTQAKLLQEEEIINQIINRLIRTFEIIETSTTNVIDFLKPNGPNAAALESLIDAQGGRERVAMINEAQFVLARKALRDFNDGKGLSLLTKQILTFKGGGKSNREQQTRVRSNKKYHTLFLARRIKVKTVEVPVFLDGSTISLNQKKLMDIVLKRPKFRGGRAENLKILTVGIPAGFSDNLLKEIGVGSENVENILDKERDVIAINVYRKSIDFEDIVFKPITYLFEMSRFVMDREINRVEIDDNKFREFLNDRSIEFMRDFSNRPRGNRQDQQAFFENEEYDFLSNRQKRKLIANHIESYILGIYLQLLTGVSTDENEYLVNDDLLQGFIDEPAREKFNDLVLTYVRGVTKEPITLEQLKESSPQIRALLDKIDDFRLNTSFTEQISPPSLPGTSVPLEQRIELTEDLINFVKLYSPKSLLTGGNIQALRLTSPKLFERIFNLAVDPDDFEIDLEKTLGTESGQKMYATLEKMDLLKNPTKLRRRNKNRTISLDQFFVNISTVGDSE